MEFRRGQFQPLARLRAGAGVGNWREVHQLVKDRSIILPYCGGSSALFPLRLQFQLPRHSDHSRMGIGIDRMGVWMKREWAKRGREMVVVEPSPRETCVRPLFPHIRLGPELTYTIHFYTQQ